MKAAAIRAISLIVLLVIPNITSSHQLRIVLFRVTKATGAL